MILAFVFNIQWFHRIYGLAHHYAWLDLAGIFFAEYLAYVLALIFCVLLVYPKAKRIPQSAMVVTATFAALVSRLVVKSIFLIFYAEPRPFVLLATKVQPLIQGPAGENLQSFPSGHALFFFAIAMVVFLFNKKWGVVFFVSAVLMGIARVYVGVHWPLDIIAGAMGGCITGVLSYLLYKGYKDIIDGWIGAVFAMLKI